MPGVVVIHYSEIAVKGKNRSFFEKKLVENVGKTLEKDVSKVRRMFGRIVGYLKKDADKKRMEEKLSQLPGVACFSFGKEVKLDLKEIEKTSLDVLKGKKFSTFRVTTRRSNKEYGKSSQQLNEMLGDSVRIKMKKKVVLKNPDATLFIEICEKEAFVYCDKYRGIGGLPVGASAKLVACLSGGIDSPVASFLMMKRGCKVVLVHFFNDTVEGKKVLGKIQNIVKELSKFQVDSKLYIIPFAGIQKEIIMAAPSRVRMIIYRRFMMKIANDIARKEKASGVITGDSVGQVASQTAENLGCIYEASKLPVFAPCIGLNKDEITGIARQVGTYKHSIVPYPDCCSFMIAQHPNTRASLERILKIEESMENKDKLVFNSISKAKIATYTSMLPED